MKRAKIVTEKSCYQKNTLDSKLKVFYIIASTLGVTGKMKIVILKSAIENGSVEFSVPESAEYTGKYFSKPLVKNQLKRLYKERYRLNSWRTFDKKDVMEKEFGR